MALGFRRENSNRHRGSRRPQKIIITTTTIADAVWLAAGGSKSSMNQTGSQAVVVTI